MGLAPYISQLFSSARQPPYPLAICNNESLGRPTTKALHGVESKENLGKMGVGVKGGLGGYF